MRDVVTTRKRIDGMDKLYGIVRYAGDLHHPGLLHASLKTSPQAFAKIVSIDTEKAKQMPGVRAILTGEDIEGNIGLYLGDKPPIAKDYVRYYGEVVAAVVADTLEQADNAKDAIEIKYEPLKPILSVEEALKENAELIHPQMDQYPHIDAIIPEPGSNIANRTKIRKGNVEKGKENTAFAAKNSVFIPVGDHVAMEPRVSITEIKKTGEVYITSATQAPYVVKSLMSFFYNIPPGKIVVQVPLVGGGFGGKAGIQLEGLSYLLSKAVHGKPVKLVNTREQDLYTSPGHMGLEATVEIGCDEKGAFTYMDIDYHFNSGAYADYAVNISRAAAISCTGPYRVENVRCDSVSVYTNMPFATAFRGFGHIEMGFAVERAIDELAKESGISSFELRKINAIRKGDTTPVGSIMGVNTGDLPQCLDRVQELLGGDIEKVEETEDRITTRGISSLWKAPAMPTNTDAGALITFNSDGSCNINSGVVEIGQGIKTALSQIASASLGIPFEKIHMVMDVNTRHAPNDWATAASRSLFMAGNAVLEACEDAKSQLKDTASRVLMVDPSELAVGDERVYLHHEPDIGLNISQVCMGYVYPNGNAVGSQVIGRGKYITRNLSGIDKETGEGRPDLEWTIGAEGVEMTIDKKTGKIDLKKAVCVMDVGKVINKEQARGQTVGGMTMGIGYSLSEELKFNSRGQVINGSLRDYKIQRFGRDLTFEVEFLETPQRDGPFGLRGLGEQSIIGMPGAIGNAISRGIGQSMNHLTYTSEKIWRAMEGVKNE